MTETITETQPLNLSKGETVDLNKQAAKALSKVKIGLGWDVASEGQDIDLDASAILFNAGNTKIGQVFYNEKEAAGGAVKHAGDNLTGEGDGDDETILVDFATLPADVDKILFTVTSFKGQPFSVLKNAYARVLDADTNTELARFELNAFGDETALYAASLLRGAEGFSLKAIGAPTQGKTFADLVPGAAQYLS